jgi:acetyltransferase-like isoleucine patch superfamily enzyme
MAGGRLIFYGAGGMGREMVQAARLDPRAKAFFDDVERPAYPGVPQIPWSDIAEEDEICLAVGQPSVRRHLTEKCAGRRFATVVAPTAVIDASATIGEGASICDFAMINSLARIGRQFQCNYYSHVSCLGTVEIGDDVFVGSGAVIRNGIPERPLRIGAGAVIGMGAVVLADVPAGAVVVGNPARA